MPRPLRDQDPGIHHVTAQGVRRSALFRDGRDRAAWIDLLPALCGRYRWRCLSYCAMTTHYHLLVRTRHANLAAGMQWLNGRWGQLFNRRHAEVGYVFRCRYFSVHVEHEEHFLEASRYLPLNPIRAGACLHPEDWPWSSYAAIVGSARVPAWLDTRELLTYFGEGAQARLSFASFVAAGVRAAD
jgi:putative transposase